MGSVKLILTVWASMASTFFTPSYCAACAQPPSGAVQYFQVKMTSSAVSGVPSDHLMSLFSFHVMLSRSFATPPLSTVGISLTSIGTSSPFSS
ncbi:hypothetical protein D3C78_1541290 [compost metagenome]